MTNVNVAELVMVRDLKVNEIEVAQGHIDSLEADLAVKLLGDTTERTARIQGDIENQMNIITQAQASIARIDTMIADLNNETVITEEVETVEIDQDAKSTIEIITDQLFEQGFYSDVRSESTACITGNHYDVSINVLEDGYELETYCTGGIDHLKSFEWCNRKVVKTLRGLNGYLRKYIGADAIKL